MRVVWAPIRFILTDVLWSIGYFPVWWYSVGTWNVVQLIAREIHGFVQAYNIKILFQFLLTPMFGQYDFAGRVISVGVRIVHFIGLTIFTVIYIALLCTLLVLWWIIPVFVVYNILFHLGVVPMIYG